MGHEAIFYGAIEGATYTNDENFRFLQERNRHVVEALPVKDDWPWLTRHIFAMPAEYPQGTYRSQVIHFGLSLKDDPHDRSCFDPWFQKFERLLRQLYWYSALVHLETEFEPPRRFLWLPTDGALDRMVSHHPSPINEWDRSMVEGVGDDTVEGL